MDNFSKHLEKGTFISSVSPYPEEEYYLGKSSWSATASDWDQRFEVGDVVADPSGSWEPGTAEAYIDQQVATITGNLASETLARQTADQSLQNQINAEVTTRYNADQSLQNQISTEANTRSTVDEQLRVLYENLTQSDIVVGPRPSSGQLQNKIYREPDQSHNPPQFYADYMWYSGAWVLMATYDNAIDDEPTPGSNNLVKSGGVYEVMNDIKNRTFITSLFTAETSIDILELVDSDISNKRIKIKVSNAIEPVTVYLCTASGQSRVYPSEASASGKVPNGTYIVNTNQNTTHVRIADIPSGDTIVVELFYADASLEDRIVNNENDINSLKEETTDIAIQNVENLAKTLYGYNPLFQNKRLNSDGTISDNQGTYVTDYIPLKSGTIGSLIWKSGVLDVNCKLCYYDAEKNVLNYYGYVSGTEREITTIRDGVYIRATFNMAFVDASLIDNTHNILVYALLTQTTDAINNIKDRTFETLIYNKTTSADVFESVGSDIANKRIKIEISGASQPITVYLSTSSGTNRVYPIKNSVTVPNGEYYVNTFSDTTYVRVTDITSGDSITVKLYSYSLEDRVNEIEKESFIKENIIETVTTSEEILQPVNGNISNKKIKVVVSGVSTEHNGVTLYFSTSSGQNRVYPKDGLTPNGEYECQTRYDTTHIRVADLLEGETVTIKIYELIGNEDCLENQIKSLQEFTGYPSSPAWVKGIPTYIKTPALKTYQRMMEWIGGDDVFLFTQCTDIHILANDTKEYLQLYSMNELNKLFEFDVLLNTGDIGQYGSFPDKATFYAVIDKIKGSMNCTSPWIFTKGNHDGAANDPETGLPFFTEGMLGNIFNGALTHRDNVYLSEDKMYGYVDFPLKKIRVYFLNTSYLQENGYDVSEAAMQWLCDSMVLIPNSYSVMWAAHTPPLAAIRYGGNAIPALNIIRYIIEAFAQRQSGSNGNVTWDFTNVSPTIKSIMYICGDSEFDGHVTQNGINWVTRQGQGYCSNPANVPPGCVALPYDYNTQCIIDIFAVKSNKFKIFRIGVGDITEDLELNY